jgi:hypothetical protein
MMETEPAGESRGGITPGPRITRFIDHGQDRLALENERIRLVLWPAHGADMLEFQTKREGIDVLWKNPRNQPPRLAPLGLPRSERSDFFDTFHGDWIFALPNGFFPADYFGAPLGTLSEFAQLPWTVAGSRSDASGATVKLTASGVRTSFFVCREVTLRAASSEVRLVTTIRNDGPVRLPVAWLEHVTLGGALLEGARVVSAAARVVGPPADRSDLGQLLAGSEMPWPHTRERGGATRDCSVVPPRGSDTEHVVMLTGLERGWAGLWNARLQLGFELRWDLQIFPLAWLWAAGRSGLTYPLWGCAHVVGIEPFTSSLRPFPELVAREEVRWIEPGAEITSAIAAGSFHVAPSSPEPLNDHA